MEEKQHFVYILGDGDRVRERIEALMLAGDLEALGVLSRQLGKAVMLIAEELTKRMAAEIFISAGDDLLVRVPAHAYNREDLEELADFYGSSTGGSISFGAGPTIDSAYLNLRRAKSSNKAKIVDN